MVINSLFQDTFRLFGQIRRQEGSNFLQFNIVLNVLGIVNQQSEVHWCTKNKKIRKSVTLMLKREDIILTYRGQYLDDDEYLMSYGYRPRFEK